MTSGVTADPDMVTRSTLTFFRRQPHDPDAGLRQARSCLREIVPVSMDEMTLPNAASDTGRRHVDGLSDGRKTSNPATADRRQRRRTRHLWPAAVPKTRGTRSTPWNRVVSEHELDALQRTNC
jgi:hypothetical protein